MTTQQRTTLLDLARFLCGGDTEDGGAFDAGEWNFYSDDDVFNKVLCQWQRVESSVEFHTESDFLTTVFVAFDVTTED